MNVVLSDAKSYIAYFFFIKYLLKAEYIKSAKWSSKLPFKNLYNLSISNNGN